MLYTYTNWKQLSKERGLSESFLEEFIHKLDGESLSVYQNLSETFMEKHWSFLQWNLLCLHQSFSFSFILQHMMLIDWENLTCNPHIVLTEEEWNKIYRMYSNQTYPF